MQLVVAITGTKTMSVNFKLSKELTKIQHSVCHKIRAKKNSESLMGIEPMTFCKTGRTL